MPSYIVKIAPDDDLYMVWSTIVDCPEWVGDLEELRETEHGKADRIARADKTGTSSFDGFYGWDHDQFYMREIVPPEHFWYRISRKDLAPYIRAILAADDFEAGWPFLTPYDMETDSDITAGAP